jgi:hypothetical protein
MGVCSTILNQCIRGTFSDLYDSSSDYRWTCNGTLPNLSTDDVICTLPLCVKKYCGENTTQPSCDGCSSKLGCSWGYNYSSSMYCYTPTGVCNTKTLVGFDIKHGASACGINADNKKVKYICSDEGKLTNKTCSNKCENGRCVSGGGSNPDPGPGPNPDPPTPTVSSNPYSLTLNPSSLNLAEGQAATVTPMLSPARDTEVFDWTSNNSGVAIVFIPKCSDNRNNDLLNDKSDYSAKCDGSNYFLVNGAKQCTKCAGANYAYVMAKKAGTAVITVVASPSGATATLNVTVKGSGQELTGIVLSPNPMNLVVGGTWPISVETIPKGLKAEYSFKNSDDSNVATVTIDGIVTGVKPGETEIIGTVKGTKITGKLKVTVTDVVQPPSPTPTGNIPEPKNCTGYLYSDFVCKDKIATRTVIGYKPEGCTGKPSENPELEQSCNTDSDVDISFKVAFSGITPNANSECLNDYFIPQNKLELDIGNVPTNKYSEVQTSFEKTDEVDSKGNLIFQVTDYILEKSIFGSVNNFNYIKIKGPWHLKRRMCQDGQGSKLSENTVCDIDLRASNTKVYDFSEYTLLAGDVFRDGLINSGDLSQIKTRLNAGGDVTCGMREDLNLDGVVNSGDLNLAKDALLERDDE